MIRILTVDDHPLIREGIRSVLKSEPDITVVAEAGNGEEAIECFRLSRPDVTLMDLQMPDMAGTDAIREIRREAVDARIIVLTTYSGDVQAVAALKAGASGYLLKNMVRKELADAIRSVHGGKPYIPNEVAAEIASHVAQAALTRRELEVLHQLALGNANKQIAALLSVSEDTVKAHVGNILHKLDANDRTHALAIAIKRGILSI
jgi:DNA-binding NarL/FixJ family response regulator